jgi:Double zinc ribbon
MSRLLAQQDDELFGGVNDFFDSTEWHLVRNLALFFVFVFWLATIFWVFKDARRRIGDPWLVAMAVLLPIVVPFLGPLIYMLFRPPEYLEDVRERELEIKAMEERVAQGELRCPVCRAEVGADFLVCPVCTTKLKQACASCKSPLEALWQICPYCETPVDSPTAVHLADSWEDSPEPRRASGASASAASRRKRPSP